MTSNQEGALWILNNFVSGVEGGKYGRDNDLDCAAFWEDFDGIQDELQMYVEVAEE